MKREFLKSRDGEKYLSEHFKVKEFACKDGSDYLKIDMDLIPLVERFRQYVENTVIINSAYRTESWNKKQGGATNSYHLYGQALDIGVDKNYKYLDTVNLMAKFFYTLKVKGIITYSWGIHIDTRKSIYYKGFTAQKINIPLYNNLKRGMESNDIGVLQFMLKQMGYNIEVDCKFGHETETCVLHFQYTNKLEHDGIVGQKTWKKILDK